MRKFFKEFKEFVSRGNVLDLAVGVIIGSAFTAIVTALTNKVIMPCVQWVLSTLGADKGLESAYTFLTKVVDPITKEVDLANSIYIDWGAFITAILNFIIIAFVVFIIIRWVNRAAKLADIDAKMKANVQNKLDNDVQLNTYESKWLERKLKFDPDNAPKKTEVVEEVPTEPELSSTDKLLAEILEQLKNKQ